MHHATATAVETATEPTVHTWRVLTGNRSDVVFALRDYFRRLGFDAAVEQASVVRMSTDLPDDEVTDYVHSWGRINGIGVSIEPAAAAPAPAPAPVPAPASVSLGNGDHSRPSAEIRPRLGEMLVGKGLISEQQLTAALIHARTLNTVLGVALLHDGMIYEEELARTLSEQLAVPYVSIMRVGVNMAAAELLPRSVGEQALAIPIREKGDVVVVAFADPTDERALEAVRRYLPEIEIAVAEFSDIRQAWRQIGVASGELPGLAC